MTHMRPARIVNWLPVVMLAAVTAASCTMKKQEAPPLTGPSEFGTSITVQITPDVLTQDGASQALVTITARDANGAPVRNLSLRVETIANGQVVDFGTLSARNVVTNQEGRATVTYTAPPGVVGGTESFVQIAVTPIGSDFNNAVTRSATVRLTPPGVIIPPAGLVPQFTVSPSAPAEDQAALFDATTSRSNTGISNYTWNFGDGTSGSGVTVTKTYGNPGNYSVTLTITDTFGRSASTTRQISVGQLAAPVADFAFSPTTGVVNQHVNFNGSASTAATGRRVVSYRWDFGDGVQETTTQPVTSHIYTLPRTYTVTLTVTDDAGRTGATSKTIAVSAQ